ncbi:MAG: FAD-dependent oxidoreductase [Cellvibrionales bacterium]|nr:FAD-dependent oxidoreductase [Cellvibrionales bacterium]
MKTKTYDLIIVGGGVIGLMGAYFAAKKGKQVLLLEAEASIRHASVRNFGSIIPSGQAMGFFRNLGERSLDWYRLFSENYGLPIDQSGTYFTAQSPSEFQLLEEKHAQDKAAGFQSQLLSSKQLTKDQPNIQAQTLGGLYYPNEMSLDSQTFLAGFLDVLSHSSHASCRFNQQVVSLESGNPHYIVTTHTQETYQAEQVLCCTGHFIPDFIRPMVEKEPVSVCKLQMLRTKPLPMRIKGNLLSGLSARRYAGFSQCPSFYKQAKTYEQAELDKHGIHLLFKQHSTGEITLGDSHTYYAIDGTESLDFHMDVEINQMMLNYANKVVDIACDEIGKLWLGWYLEHDKGLLAKSQNEGLHVITAISGKGMTIGPALMEKTIDKIFDSAFLEFDL